MEKNLIRAADDIMRAAQLAAALEVSGWPKPGNIHRTADFKDTTFEHYIAGSIAIGPAMREAALQGIRAALKEIQIREVGIGRSIKNAVKEVKAWHKGGNTHLGVTLLFVPLAAAAGYTYTIHGKMELESLRGNSKKIMESSTPQDAVEAFKAINMATPAALGRMKGFEAPDLTDRDADKTIIGQEISLHETMEVASSWDGLAYEWTSGMSVSFKLGYPTFKRIFEETKDINTATVHTFLTILSHHPDTFIARKIGAKETEDARGAVEIGMEVARAISDRALKVLELGGLLTEKGRAALSELDDCLRRPRNELNPGTTADLTAASLMIAILCGFRP
ncbi:MAG: ATP--dephospho-CoA triphosphoribosyl transferase CitG [Nitrososphaeria archaeon]|nr:ATP--dephospho-CoA triphosphoribosyl transferase CitG [Nitrososphaeria archaeon]NIN51596.1 ATP--dephospho-CoA triphosphoribosyl transferase CitG [Nitrososphaeria archaeon]NIQ32081.1 ATP--dephospho-CoA triphosphoribosyl transferase CitG [Nitrososphaeria archaeon]